MANIEGVETFEQFLLRMKISSTADVLPLLKETWNAAVSSASQCFEYWEGADHGTKKKLTVPE